MGAANLSKGGSLLLLSCFSRGGVHRPPLSTICYSPSLSYGHSPILLRGMGKGALGHWNCDDKRITAAATRKLLFCTASPNNLFVDSPSPPSDAPPPESSVKDEEGDNVDKLKDVANTLDLRVGQILKIWRHEEADSLYVEEVDVGEPEPRIICSGLVKFIPLDHLQDKKVVVLANLKPRNMRGVKSYGMLMAASDASHENVELLVPPEGSLPGERVWFGSEDEKENLPDAASPNQIQKKKIWESVQPHLKTDASCVATLGEHLMRTSAGLVVSGYLKNANIS